MYVVYNVNYKLDERIDDEHQGKFNVPRVQIKLRSEDIRGSPLMYII